MSKPVYTVLFCLLTFSWAVGQKVEVKVNKDTDFSRFRTFYMMPGEVVLVLNKEVSREALKEGVRKGVIANLEDKGYQQTTDSTSADLAITFVAEVVERLEQQNLGPFGQTPMRTPVDMRSDTWTQEIRSGSLVIE